MQGIIWRYISVIMRKSINKNINLTLRSDICTGCGICVGGCPNNAISTIIKCGRFVPFIDDNQCKSKNGCHRCYEVCPGVGVNLVEIARTTFIDKAVKENKYIGRYICSYTGYSTNDNLRYHSASGGMVSQFLIWLLENKKIDGAVVTRFDKDNPLKVKSFIARTKDDVLAAKSSKYAPVSFHEAVKELNETPEGRYVVVGLPCHIQGMRKLMAVDKRIREKIFGLFGIFCSGSRTFYMTEYLMQNRNIELNKLNYLAYRDNGCLGGLVAKGEGIDFYEDYQSYCHPLRTMFHPRRCLLCIDHFAELADVSFGDIHIAPYKDDKIGVNSVVVRNTMWHEFLIQAENSGCITMDNLDINILLKSQKMAKIKKSRYVGYGLMMKKLGKMIPDYGTTYGISLKPQYIVGYLWNSIDRFVGSHKVLWPFISLIKSKVIKR